MLRCFPSPPSLVCLYSSAALSLAVFAFPSFDFALVLFHYLTSAVLVFLRLVSRPGHTQFHFTSHYHSFFSYMCLFYSSVLLHLLTYLPCYFKYLIHPVFHFPDLGSVSWPVRHPPHCSDTPVLPVFVFIFILLCSCSELFHPFLKVVFFAGLLYSIAFCCSGIWFCPLPSSHHCLPSASLSETLNMTERINILSLFFGRSVI